MFNLTTINDERMTLPPAAIRGVLKGVSAPCSIVVNIGGQLRIDHLKEQYGFVKKMVIDSCMFENPIEVRLLEGPDFVEGSAFFPRACIEGWREVKEGGPVKTALYVDLLGGSSQFNVADTIDELALAPAEATPAPAADEAEVLQGDQTPLPGAKTAVAKVRRRHSAANKDS